jgi:HD superfamily phosphohydrolase
MDFFSSPFENLDGKLINDPLHGMMGFDSTTLRFIDTPQFQRLRNLKQLGFT